MHQRKLDAQPLRYSIKNSIYKGTTRYDLCPLCRTNYKSPRSPCCRSCSIWENKPPKINRIFLVCGAPCRKVPLTLGKYALVDAQLYEQLMQDIWHASGNPTYGYYARTFRGKQSIFMHNLIMRANNTRQYDHHNHDGLDNRRSNLRKCTKSNNAANFLRRKQTNLFTYRGVYKVPRYNRWRASIRKNGVTKFLGYFSTPKEAAKAYDKAASKYHKEFAVLNFPS